MCKRFRNKKWVGVGEHEVIGRGKLKGNLSERGIQLFSKPRQRLLGKYNLTFYENDTIHFILIEETCTAKRTDMVVIILE
jgi:hypothetical protein